MRPLLLLLAPLLATCAPAWRPVDLAALERTKAKTIVLVIRRPTAFRGPPPFLFNGPVMAMSVGRGIVDDNDLDDPAVRLGTELATSFARSHELALKIFEEPEPPPMASAKMQGPRPLPPTPPAADLMLEVRTSAWGIESVLGRAPIVRYSAELALMTPTKQALASGVCRGDLGKNAKPTTEDYDQLLADGAARLKRALTILADRCIDQMSANLLRVSASRPAPTVVPAAPPPRPQTAPPPGPAQQQADPE